MNQHYAARFEFGDTPALATIDGSSLRGGAHIEYTGVAMRDLAQSRAIGPLNMPPSPTASPCVFAGDTLYRSAKDPKMASFPDHTAEFMHPQRRTNCARQCAICSTTHREEGR
jgi:hypothetical protein